jgi:HEPN domain-containing protein
MSRDEIVKYWQDSAEMDFQAMETLFKNGHFVWALFVGHLVVEKLLKAYYFKRVDSDSPQIHNLLKIAEKAQFELSEDQKIFLDEVTTFKTSRLDTLISRTGFIEKRRKILPRNIC